MEDFDLSRTEWIVLGVVALVAVVIPGWIKSISNRRRYGRREARHGYRFGAVLFGMVPMSIILVVWFVVTAFLIGFYIDQIPEKYHTGSIVLLCIIDVGALVVSMHFSLPAGYLVHLDGTPRGLHTPLDWLVGLLMSVVFFSGGFLQVMYIIGSKG